jgi:hypothetical protein
MGLPEIRANKALEAVEKAIISPDKSSASPENRGIHELLGDAIALLTQLDLKLEMIKKRLAEFDSLQSRFYKGENQ